MRRLLLYCGRWQLSSPILIGVIYTVNKLYPDDVIIGPIIANLIGALIFFKVDEWILTKRQNKL